ncbi:MAG: hypothetical protein GF344_15440 [Chitinivibrionales bacterium]|nr:hypothetical protein [Chitinivibrionales bacterium]MBD3358098.1 hypothetical protein [Chitinivibrionales bacterium]
MIPFLRPIPARVTGERSSKFPEGRGVVEKRIDRKTVVIRTAAGKATVQLRAGTLHEGDPVLLTRIGSELLIHPVTDTARGVGRAGDTVQVDTPPSGQAISDAAQLIARINDILASSTPEWQGDRLAPLLEQLEKAIRAAFIEAQPMRLALNSNEVTTPSAAGLSPHSIHHLLELLGKLEEIATGPIKERAAQVREALMKTPVFSDMPVGSTGSLLLLSPTSSPEPGLYRFDTVAMALEWLSEHREAKDNDRRPPSTGYGDKPVIVKIHYQSERGLVADVLTPRGALLEVEHTLRSEMQSTTLQRMPTEAVTAALDVHGMLPRSLLSELDSALAAYEHKQASNEAGLTGQALRMTLPQVVGLALSSHGTVSTPLAAALTSSAGDIPALVESLSRLIHLQESSLNMPPPPESYAIHEGKMGAGIPRTELVPHLFRALGFDFEAGLVRAAPNGAGDRDDAKSLKQVLLELLKLIETRDTAKGEGEERYLPSETRKGLGEESAGTGIRGRFSPLSLLRRTEGALTRLESLQVLSRPVQSGDGARQVVAFPMKIDGEWTEARVRFVKKRPSKKTKRSSGRYAVTLTVNPSALGEITIAMDYQRGGAFTARLHFERPAVRQWFGKRDHELASALGSLGFGAVHLEMKHSSEHRADESRPSASFEGGEQRGGFSTWG